VNESPEVDLSTGTSTGVDPRLSILLCYTAWWVSGLIFLIIETQHRDVRFHAAQSLVLFGGLTVLIALLTIAGVGMLVVSGTAFQALRLLMYLVWLGAMLLWLLVMVRTFRGESWRVPFAADLADKIAAR
jgi:uncharacterized membrane protein